METRAFFIPMVMSPFCIDPTINDDRINREITEVELEAIAVGRIGRVYDKVLKLKYRAKEYYKHAIQLAHSMYPRTFTLEGITLMYPKTYALFNWACSPIK